MDILAAVAALENALARGQLAAALEQDFAATLRDVPSLLEPYVHLAATGARERTPARRFLFQRLADEASSAARSPRACFRAIPILTPRHVVGMDGATEDTARAPMRLEALEVYVGSSVRVLPAGAAVAARAWGIRFTELPSEVEADLEEAFSRKVVERLGAGLSALPRLLRYLPVRTQPSEPTPLGGALALERLMVDVLNEHIPCASLAPLAEDLLEQTDLRVKVPGLERRRGARVQVTWFTGEHHHVRKVLRMHRPEEWVVLSPRSLAAALLGPQGGHILAREEREALLAGLESSPRRLDAVAERIRQTLQDALEQAHREPRGPAEVLPLALRRLIQGYVTLQAFESTSCLRRRHAREGRSSAA